jgi:hypothetical protein
VKPNGRPEPKPGRPETVTRAGFLHLGPLKGNIGDQNYDVPADADLENIAP